METTQTEDTLILLIEAQDKLASLRHAAEQADRFGRRSHHMWEAVIRQEQKVAELDAIYDAEFALIKAAWEATIAAEAAGVVAVAETILAAALPYTTANVHGKQAARSLELRRAGNAFITAQREQEEAQEAYDNLMRTPHTGTEEERAITRLVDAGFARWQTEGRNVAAYDAWMAGC